ncbi:neutral and basic amino acid transport protein rBAT-like isoform X1 [Schistocerca americana]|uniref:neutral and basic amino acid transport protein rBAT-like isoform X1 n=1 Tax=Schistocerca americana TaxID=7009 RepID=UPI001F4FDAB0|nr:neutral and basic amino acid transport protein rBAT-like isoform X1 [Schistocerca americana]XP_047001675.1 neutral and basic amino acid transport protein rBAT-like isoform X1 [Schistocerca americana]
MDIPGQSSILEATRLGETAFSAMEVSGSETADKTPSPGAGSEFLVDEEAASTCPLLTPSPPAGAFHISLTAVARPPGMAYEHQISPSITDPELSSSLPGLDGAPGFTAMNDANVPAHDSSPAIEDGPSGAFPGVAATLESSSSSSSVLHEPTVCAQLLNSHHYAHLTKGPDVAAFVCQENGGKSPLSAIQLAVSPSAKDYPFLNWNWRIIRRISFLGAMSLIVATACAVIAIMVSIPKSCKPAHEWWQGTLFYEIFPASFMDSNADGVGDFPGMLQHMKYLDNLGVRVVHLNSIFAADHYPDHFAHPKNLLEIDPSLGTLKDFQAVVSILHQRNISVVVDLPVAEAIHVLAGSDVTTYNDTSHEETYTKAIFADAEDDIIAEAVEFWLNQGIDGFYLKGLEYVVHGSDFSDSIIRWRKLIDKFPSRILMCSMAAINALDFDANLRHMVLSHMDLVDVYINISSANAGTEIKEQVNKIFFGPVFGSRPNYPWIHWNMGSVETDRLVNRLQTANGSLAALLFNMMLPGTTSVFYGDEIGLENYHNIEHPDVDHPRQVVPMHWTDGPGLGFTTSRVLPWVSPSVSHTTVSNGLQHAIGKMSDLRNDNPVIYMNGVWKEGQIRPNYYISYADNDIVVMERFYPRRHMYIVVTNLAPHKQVRDLSYIYFGGTIKVDLLGRTGQYITFRSLTLYPGETIVLQLDN